MALVNILIVLALCWLVAVKAGLNEDYLREHNRLRKDHGTPALILDDSLSKGCEEYAKELAEKEVMAHSTDGGTKYGENLCMRSEKPLQCVQDWYDEIEDYNFDNPGFSMGTGHFTALVWKSAKKLGIGQAKDKQGHYWVVGRYYPPVNVYGKFKENVPRPLSQSGGGGGQGQGHVSSDDNEDNSNMIRVNTILILIALCLLFTN
ncbi:Golgi-associated plant pathogenesis-related protein 1-like [Drosophila takahashii]|uniref:Golgi-associated plant pathogenesis-related protein 1-like n=1 Tax=Drosophila takahashii TaxID=29030 RepID=UPI001CF90D4E|nr:Golgi-associated plant pathogenesis-related protein 1-like [Drosophila takahashii]